MITTRFQNAARRFVAALALGTLGLGIGLAAAPSTDAAGLRNCVDISGPQSGRVGCYEDVWANGAQYRMTFSNTRFSGAAPAELDPFYVLAAQTDAPQGAPPNTFAHDHVVRTVPGQGDRPSSVRMQGFFVMCSGQGIVSGACVPVWTSLGGDPLPLAKTVGGHPLTSTEAIEAGADSGDLALINLGPGAVIVGAITRSN